MKGTTKGTKTHVSAGEEGGADVDEVLEDGLVVGLDVLGHEGAVLHRGQPELGDALDLPGRGSGTSLRLTVTGDDAAALPVQLGVDGVVAQLEGLELLDVRLAGLGALVLRAKGEWEEGKGGAGTWVRAGQASKERVEARGGSCASFRGEPRMRSGYAQGLSVCALPIST
jgi:hypothetical protein